MSKVGDAITPAKTPGAATKSRAIRWDLIQTIYMRALSLGWLALGLVAWSVIIGADPTATRPFETRAVTFQAVTIYFAVIDILAAVGLWLLAPWGGVVWLIATVSRLVIGFVFPASLPLSITTALVFAACIVLFMALSVMVGRRARY